MSIPIVLEKPSHCRLAEVSLPITSSCKLYPLYCPASEMEVLSGLYFEKLLPLGDQYTRVDIGGLAKVRQPDPMHTVYIPHTVPDVQGQGPVPQHILFLDELLPVEMKIISPGLIKIMQERDAYLKALTHKQCVAASDINDGVDDVSCFAIFEHSLGRPSCDARVLTTFWDRI